METESIDLLNKELNNAAAGGEALPQPVMKIIYFIYGVIAVTGVTGNALVLFVVFRKSSMRSITNMFIANLSVSDILMGLITTVFTPVTTIQENNFSINEIFCKILSMTMGVSVYVSTLTCTAIAAERFFVIVHPFLPKMKPWLCGIIIALVWLVGIIISMPLGLYQKVGTKPDSNVTFCIDDWPKNSSVEIFTIVSFMLQYVVPGSVISYCYYKISMLLKTRYQNKLDSRTMNRFKEERELQRKRRTNSMLIAMVIIFFVCWIPINVLWITVDLYFLSDAAAKEKLALKPIFKLAFFICHMIAMSSAVYNPFLYAWMNENFRKEFRSLLPFLFKAQSPINHPTEETTMKNKSQLCLEYSSMCGKQKRISKSDEELEANTNLNTDNNGTVGGNQPKCSNQNDLIEHDLFLKEEDV